MNRSKEKENVNLQEERGATFTGGNAVPKAANTLKLEHRSEQLDGLRQRLRETDQRMKELASSIPPLTPEQIHAIVGAGLLSQFEYRRRCDRYLLAFCLCFLALVASVLWYTAPAGLSPINVALVLVAVVDMWVTVRAAYSLWLMRQSLRLRPYPYRMARCADRLARLSRRRHLWLRFILRGTYPSSEPGFIRQELFSLRLPSYSIAACFLLFLAVNTGTAFAATRDYAKVTTTTESTDNTICDTVNDLMAQL